MAGPARSRAILESTSRWQGAVRSRLCRRTSRGPFDRCAKRSDFGSAKPSGSPGRSSQAVRSIFLAASGSWLSKWSVKYSLKSAVVMLLKREMVEVGVQKVVESLAPEGPL